MPALRSSFSTMKKLHAQKLPEYRGQYGASSALEFGEGTVSMKEKLTEDESHAAIETLLLVSAGTIAWLRKLFPSTCYVKEQFTSIADVIRYTRSASLARQASNGQGSFSRPLALERYGHYSSIAAIATSYPLKVLARGQMPQCDQLLRWLELIVAALKKQQIAAVSLRITQKDADPCNSLESYTFSFNYYMVSTTESPSLKSVSLLGHSGKPVTVTDVTEGLDRMLDRLVQLCMQFPTLPDKRFLVCYTQFTSICPLGFAIEGFTTSFEDIYVPSDEKKEWKQSGLRPWNSGIHLVTLTVGRTYLEVVEDGKDMRCDTTYPKTTSRPRESQQSTQAHVLATEWSLDRITTGRDAGQTTFSTPIRRQETLAVEGESHLVAPHSTSTKKTSSNYTSKRPASRNGSLRTTQGLPAELRLARPPRKWRLKLAKMQEIQVNSKASLHRGLAQDYAAGTDLVRCQCYSKDCEGDEMRCVSCHTLQHRQCYGFLTDEPSVDHVCYQCLFARTSDKMRLQSLQKLAQKRRMLWLLYDRGWNPNDQRFYRKLGYDRETAKLHLQYLKSEGYLGTGAAPKDVSRDHKERRQEEFGNPMTHLRHLYDPIKNAIPVSSAEGSQAPPEKRIRIDRT